MSYKNIIGGQNSISATSQPQCSTGGSNLTIADDLTVIMRTTIMEFGTSRDKYWILNFLMSPLPFDFQPPALPIYLKYSNTILAHYKNAELHKMSKLAVMPFWWRYHLDIIKSTRSFLGNLICRDTLMARNFLRLHHPYDFWRSRNSKYRFRAF